MLIYRIAADLVLALHAGIVGFVVFGQALVLVGLPLRWRWVRNFWFRVAHLLAIGVVVAQAWAGVVCPLTMLENHLRVLGGGVEYPGSFVAYWLHWAIFYRADTWVFTLLYTVFATLVLATWILGPPRRKDQEFQRRPSQHGQ